MSDVSRPTAEFSGRTVLVTGGAGFVGRHLVGALVPSNDVRVLDDCSTGDPSALPAAVTLFEADVTDETMLAAAMDGVDVVFHLAAVVSVEQSVEAPTEAHRVNVDGTLAVLERARAEDARVVVASSAAVYGDAGDPPIDESTPGDPRSPYGADKLAADVYARAYESTYGVPTVVLRYFNVYGPGQRGPYSGVIDAFLRRAVAGEPLVIHGDGRQTRDFVHVFDVVRANLAAATTEHTGVAFNVGTGESIAIRDLAALVRDVADADSGVRHTEPRPGDVRHSRASTDRVEAHLGVEPRIRLREGLTHLLAHRRDAGEAAGPPRRGE